jgi:hypothetical protein
MPELDVEYEACAKIIQIPTPQGSDFSLSLRHTTAGIIMRYHEERRARKIL